MRKIIVILLSIIFIVFGVLFAIKITNNISNQYILFNGELEFIATKITSINMPDDDTKIIDTLDEMKEIVLDHNFNTKHSYIYIKFSGDNMHKYKITNVIKNDDNVTCVIEDTALPENENIEKTDLTYEYMLDINGLLDKKLNVNLSFTSQISSSNEQ